MPQHRHAPPPHPYQPWLPTNPGSLLVLTSPRGESHAVFLTSTCVSNPSFYTLSSNSEKLLDSLRASMEETDVRISEIKKVRVRLGVRVRVAVRVRVKVRVRVGVRVRMGLGSGSGRSRRQA